MCVCVSVQILSSIFSFALISRPFCFLITHFFPYPRGQLSAKEETFFSIAKKKFSLSATLLRVGHPASFKASGNIKFTDRTKTARFFGTRDVMLDTYKYICLYICMYVAKWC